MLEEWPGPCGEAQLALEAEERWVQYVLMEQWLGHLRRLHALEEREWRKVAPNRPPNPDTKLKIDNNNPKPNPNPNPTWR